MSSSKTKKKPLPSGSVARVGARAAKPAAAAALRAQTRRMLGKHYRAKYGVR